MHYLIPTLLVQIALVVHVLRTGRPVYWVFLIMFMPGIGAIAYVVVELLPDLAANHRARRALRGIRKSIDPTADIRRHERMQKLSGSVDASRHLADELTASGRYAEAIVHYEEALTGLYEHDPDLLLGLAQAQFGDRHYEEARKTLERLAEHNPDYKSADGHLLLARSLEQCGNLEDAEREYAAVSAYYAGAEAKLRYGLLLEKLGKTEAAKAVFEDLLAAAELAPSHYRKAQRAWISEARHALRRLPA